MDFCSFGEAEFQVHAIGVEEFPLVVLGEAEVEGGIGKDSGGGGELEVDLSQIPSAKDEDDGDEEEGSEAEGDEDAIDHEESRHGEGKSRS